NGDAIEAAIRIRKVFSISFLETDNAIEPALGGALAPHLEHVGIDVTHGHSRPRATGFGDAESDVPGPAGEIKQRKFAPRTWRVYRRHQRVLPGPVQAARHQVVHEVIAAGDRMEDVVHAP